jgi:hypothetical protein
VVGIFCVLVIAAVLVKTGDKSSRPEDDTSSPPINAAISALRRGATPTGNCARITRTSSIIGRVGFEFKANVNPKQRGVQSLAPLSGHGSPLEHFFREKTM